MTMGWSIAGKRVELKPGFGSAKLVVDGVEATKLKAKGEFAFQIEGQRYTLERKPGLMASQDTLRAPDGRIVPPTAKHVAAVRPEPGSRCAKHPERTASLGCPRCGSFACAECTGADATHCEACAARLLDAAQRHARDLMVMTPAFIFIVVGGALGALLGAAAGAAAVAIARRTESTAVKWIAAVGLYVVAAVLFVILAGALQLAAGR